MWFDMFTYETAFRIFTDILNDSSRYLREKLKLGWIYNESLFNFR